MVVVSGGRWAGGKKRESITRIIPPVHLVAPEEGGFECWAPFQIRKSVTLAFHSPPHSELLVHIPLLSLVSGIEVPQCPTHHPLSNCLVLVLSPGGFINTIWGSLRVQLANWNSTCCSDSTGSSADWALLRRGPPEGILVAQWRTISSQWLKVYIYVASILPPLVRWCLGSHSLGFDWQTIPSFHQSKREDFHVKNQGIKIRGLITFLTLFLFSIGCPLIVWRGNSWEI